MEPKDRWPCLGRTAVQACDWAHISTVRCSRATLILADYILLCALAGQGVTELRPLDDHDEWAAHRAFAARWIRAS